MSAALPLLVVAFFFLLTIAFGLALVPLVRQEAESAERTDRESGERMARRDTK